MRIASSFGLRTHLIALAVGLVTLVIVLTNTYFIEQHRRELNRMAERHQAAMRAQIEEKGVTIAQTIAGTSERAVAMHDFLFLSEVVEATVRRDPEVLYGIVMDADKKAIIHGQLELRGTVLDDDLSRAAAEMPAGTQTIADTHLEAVAPLIVAGERWGTVRFGVSLESLNAAIAEDKARVKNQILRSVVATVVAGVVLLVLSSLIGTIAAARITRPLHGLLAGVRQIESGNLDPLSTTRHGLGREHMVDPPEEYAVLGRAFDDMASAVRERDVVLRKRNVELNNALEEAQEASRLKSEFVANVSHELRTPLNAIVNVPGALLADYENRRLWHCPACDVDYEQTGAEATRCPDCASDLRAHTRLVFAGSPEEHRASLDRVAQSGTHLLNVVSDLLDFSKLEAGKMSLSKSDVDLKALMSEIQGTLSGLAEREHIEVLYPESEMPIIQADRVKLTQILINLIGNAIKYTDRGGHVDVRVIDSEEHVRLEVEDDGRGIERAQLEVIFESFRQLDAGHTRKQGGTGLGLAISRKLVELHEGEIWADSEVGKGSVFYVSLPKTS